MCAKCFYTKIIFRLLKILGGRAPPGPMGMTPLKMGQLPVIPNRHFGDKVIVVTRPKLWGGHVPLSVTDRRPCCNKLQQMKTITWDSWRDLRDCRDWWRSVIGWWADRRIAGWWFRLNEDRDRPDRRWTRTDCQPTANRSSNEIQVTIESVSIFRREWWDAFFCVGWQVIPYDRWRVRSVVLRSVSDEEL